MGAVLYVRVVNLGQVLHTQTLTESHTRTHTHTQGDRESHTRTHTHTHTHTHTLSPPQTQMVAMRSSLVRQCQCKSKTQEWGEMARYKSSVMGPPPVILQAQKPPPDGLRPGQRHNWRSAQVGVSWCVWCG